MPLWTLPLFICILLGFLVFHWISSSDGGDYGMLPVLLIPTGLFLCAVTWLIYFVFLYLHKT